MHDVHPTLPYTLNYNRCIHFHKDSSPILDYEHRAWSCSRIFSSQPAGDISHKPGGRLPLLSTRPAVTFPAKEIIPFAGTKLFAAW